VIFAPNPVQNQQILFFHVHPILLQTSLVRTFIVFLCHAKGGAGLCFITACCHCFVAGKNGEYADGVPEIHFFFKKLISKRLDISMVKLIDLIIG